MAPRGDAMADISDPRTAFQLRQSDASFAFKGEPPMRCRSRGKLWDIPTGFCALARRIFRLLTMKLI